MVYSFASLYCHASLSMSMSISGHGAEFVLLDSENPALLHMRQSAQLQRASDDAPPWER